MASPLVVLDPDATGRDLERARGRVIADLERRATLVVSADEELNRKRTAHEARAAAWRANRTAVTAELARKAAEVQAQREALHAERLQWEQQWTQHAIDRALAASEASSLASPGGGAAAAFGQRSDSWGMTPRSADGALEAGGVGVSLMSPSSAAGAVSLAANEAVALRRARAALESERETLSRELNAALASAREAKDAAGAEATKLQAAQRELHTDRMELVSECERKVSALRHVRDRLEIQWATLRKQRAQLVEDRKSQFEEAKVALSMVVLGLCAVAAAAAAATAAGFVYDFFSCSHFDTSVSPSPRTTQAAALLADASAAKEARRELAQLQATSAATATEVPYTRMSLPLINSCC